VYYQLVVDFINPIDALGMFTSLLPNLGFLERIHIGLACTVGFHLIKADRLMGHWATLGSVLAESGCQFLFAHVNTATAPPYFVPCPSG